MRRSSSLSEHTPNSRNQMAMLNLPRQHPLHPAPVVLRHRPPKWRKPKARRPRPPAPRQAHRRRSATPNDPLQLQQSEHPPKQRPRPAPAQQLSKHGPMRPPTSPRVNHVAGKKAPHPHPEHRANPDPVTIARSPGLGRGRGLDKVPPPQTQPSLHVPAIPDRQMRRTSSVGDDGAPPKAYPRAPQLPLGVELAG